MSRRFTQWISSVVDALAGSSVAAGDKIPIVDASAGVTKYIAPADIAAIPEVAAAFASGAELEAHLTNEEAHLASAISVADVGTYFTADDVEGALQELGALASPTGVAETARDAVGAALVAGEGIDITVSDGSDTITIDAELASDTNPGVAELATSAETVTGSDTGRVVTPAGGAAAYVRKVAGGAAVEDLGAVESNVNTVAASGSTETLDTSVYAVHDVTMDQACTFTFSNPAPSGKATVFVLILRGAFTPTWPAAVKWPSGSLPTHTTPSMWTFTTVDAGTTWYGTQCGKAFA